MKLPKCETNSMRWHILCSSNFFCFVFLPHWCSGSRFVCFTEKMYRFTTKKIYRLATISRFGLALLHMWKIRALRFEPYSYKALTFCSPSAASSFCFDAFAGYWFLYAYKWHLFGIYFLPTNCINQMNDFDIRISCNGLPPPKLLEMRQKART